VSSQPLDPRRVPTPKPAKRPPPSRGERALALAEDLAEDLAAVELDAIDGEFYWRCCRGDLLELVEDLGEKGPRLPGVKAPPKPGMPANDEDSLSGTVEPDGFFAYLREGLRLAGEFIALGDEAALLYPEVVWRRLLEGERVAMRAAEAEVRGPFDGGDPPGLILRVFSGAWTGAQVEDEVRRLVAGRPEWFERARVVPTRSTAVGVWVDFSLGEQRHAMADGEDGVAPRSPCVEVSVPVPLPPPGAIAREYDALVRNEFKWHLGLLGGGSRQDKEVAVRTWTVGLLMAEGMLFPDAMHVCASRTELLEVSQSRFGQDRLKLLERVPEARPYIFVRGPGAEAAARAETPPTLANPAAPLPPLQAPASEEGAYT
jgi:hypothetical protein